MIRKVILWATKGKPLSRKLTAAWVTHVLTLAVAWVVSRYGLDLSIGDSSLVSGICSAIAAPIAGFLVTETARLTEPPALPESDRHNPVPSPFAPTIPPSGRVVRPDLPTMPTRTPGASPVESPDLPAQGRHAQPAPSAGSLLHPPVPPTPPLPKGESTSPSQDSPK